MLVPQEHFDVAFCMFDLDGDGTVDKQEFAHVIENFLNTVTLKETGRMPAISVEGTIECTGANAAGVPLTD